MRVLQRSSALLVFALVAILIGAALAFAAPTTAHAASNLTKGEADTSTPVDMYRMYNPESGEHLYTADKVERDYLKTIGWRYEGIGWVAPSVSNTPVYRLFNKNEPLGDHHYTTDKDEYDSLVSLGWSGEGVSWYSDDKKTVALYRVYNPNAYDGGLSGAHHYTSDHNENNTLVTLGWNAEGIGWYGMRGGVPAEDWVSELQVARTANQIITVEARGTRATVSLHAKIGGKWHVALSTTDGWVGASGIGPAQEGVDYTPIGVMYPTMAFGIQPDPGCPMGYLQVDDSHYWCGDSNSWLYNSMVSTRDTTDFDTSVSEHIIDCGDTYNYCLDMGWNVERTPHGGSAFFLHCSQGKPTGGCVTVPQDMMIQILRTVRPGCVIIIDTPSGMAKYR